MSSQSSRSLTRSNEGTGWLLAGLALVALGAFAWYTMGPDLRRYLKIRSM